MSRKSHGPCQTCGSLDVVQIRTARRDVEMVVAGVKLQLSRLYLDRCRSCGRVMLYGKTSLGTYRKSYLPAFADDVG